MGISEAFYIPAALALIADYHTGPTRSRAVGLHQMAIYCRRDHRRLRRLRRRRPDLGWRFAFDACGVFGMAYAVPLVLLLREPASAQADGAESRTHVASVRALRELLGNGSFILLVLYFTLPAMAGWVVRDWMPAILKEEFHIGQGQAGRGGDALLAGGGDRRRARRRLAGGPLDAAARRAAASSSARSAWSLIVPAIFGVGNAADRPALGGGRVPDPVRPRLGLLRLQQHADPLPDRAARAARDRLRHHELREHQLRRPRRLGLRRAARPASAAQRDLRRLRRRRRSSRSCSCC